MTSLRANSLLPGYFDKDPYSLYFRLFPGFIRDVTASMSLPRYVEHHPFSLAKTSPADG